MISMLMKRLLIPVLWVPLSVVFIITIAYAAFFHSSPVPNYYKALPTVASQNYQEYSSLPFILGKTDRNPDAFYVQSSDIVPKLVRTYLKKYNSPMLQSYQQLINAARKYGIDPLLMVAIAQCESNLGNKMPHEDSEDPLSCHNPFGWGIYTNSTLCFDSWEEGYLAVAQGLRLKYYNQGLNNTEDIMTKYTPPALENNGSWAKCVNHFRQDLDELQTEVAKLP